MRDLREEKRAYWRNLDNAGKLFSAASTSKDTRVFRFYCVLKEQVQKEILQEAVNLTVKKYPIFLSVMRKGLFWHYLEKSELRPVVKEEDKEPCSCLYVRDKKALLFEVTYYQNRINFEVFHALTDGTGATLFLKEIVENYLYLAHKEEGFCICTDEQERIAISAQESDSFTKYYDPSVKMRRKKRKHAFQIQWGQQEYEPLQVSEATGSATELLQIAREKGVSLTVLITAAMIMAIHKTMTKAQEKKPVILMIPVNLRKIFPSESMLNFFGYIEPEYKFGNGKDEFEDVLEAVKMYFTENLTQEEIARRMNELIAFEKHKILRWAPLDLKNACIRAGAKMAEKEVTAVFSNMSVVKLPNAYEPYVERFGVYTSTPRTELCVVSYADTVNFGFTSRYDSQEIQRHFYEILGSLGAKTKRVKPEYPKDAKPNYEGRKFMKSFSYVCIVVAVFAAMANAIVSPEGHWSILIGGGILSMWFALMVGYTKRHNLMKNAMWELLIVTLGGVLWDVCTGWHGWSVNWVLPCVSILIQISMLVISKIQSHSPREYMIYYVMANIYGVVLPLICMLTKIAVFRVPSILCMGFSFLFFFALLMFKGREFREEIYKKFHV